jgi:hypothetical protein
MTAFSEAVPMVNPTLTRMLRGRSAPMQVNQGRMASIAATSHSSRVANRNGTSSLALC